MRHLRSTPVLMLALGIVGCSVTVEHEDAGPGVSDFERQIDAWANAAVEAGEVAGLSIAVARDGEIELARGYGYADLELQVPAGVDTVYRIGSITKQFTAAAVMRLVEEGSVDLDARLQEYVDFPTGDRVVTIDRLLNHTSGIKSYTGLGERWRRTVPLALSHDELLGMVRDEPFDFEPGDEYRYNNTGYYLLGVLVENQSGQSYGEHVEQTLAAPLRLDHTTYCDEKRIIPGRAEGYELEDDELLNDDPISMNQPFAAGALCSTVLDLLRWQEALAGGEVVSADSYRRMTTAGTTNDGESIGYGYGLGIGDLEGHRIIRHGGGINGFVTWLGRLPDDGIGIVILTNTPGPTAARLSDRIARLALGLEIEAE